MPADWFFRVVVSSSRVKREYQLARARRHRLTNRFATRPQFRVVSCCGECHDSRQVLLLFLVPIVVCSGNVGNSQLGIDSGFYSKTDRWLDIKTDERLRVPKSEARRPPSWRTLDKPRSIEVFRSTVSPGRWTLSSVNDGKLHRSMVQNLREQRSTKTSVDSNLLHS